MPMTRPMYINREPQSESSFCTGNVDRKWSFDHHVIGFWWRICQETGFVSKIILSVLKTFHYENKAFGQMLKGIRLLRINVELQRQFDALFASSFLPTHKKQDTQENVSEQEKDYPQDL